MDKNDFYTCQLRAYYTLKFFFVNNDKSFHISVTSPERRIDEKSTGIRDDVYTSYQIESVGKESTCRVWRRYNEFLQLRQYLEAIHPSCIIPPMPAKRTGDVWTKLTQDNFDPDFIAMRQIGLEKFLHRVKAQPKLASDKVVYEFLTNDTSWPELVESTGYQKKSGPSFRIYKIFCESISTQWKTQMIDLGVKPGKG